MRKSNIILILILGAFGCSFIVFFSKIAVGLALPAISRDGNDNQQKVFRRNALQKEAKKLAERGELNLALAKYEEAIQSENINYEYEKAVAKGAMMEIYKWKKEYGKATELLNWYFKNSRTGEPTEVAMEEKREIEALIEYERTGDTKQVYSVIERLRQSNKDALPPVGYPLSAATVISNILRLYDTIGDHDAGITYVDETLAFLKKKKADRNENAEIYDQIKTVNQADECAGLDIFPVTKRHPEWRACKLIREYLLVREAFEKDKAEGTKGRTTQALIQSDYFPW